MATSSTPTAEWKPSQGASIASIAIGAALAAVYFALAQANLTFDGAMYLVDPRAEGQPQKLFHLAFHLYLPATLALGRALGLSAPAAGAAQSALLAAAGVAVAHWAMRRESISPAPAATFALALGLSPTVLENATTVELYGGALFALSLSLAAFLAEARAPSRLGAAALLAASLAVILIQFAFAPWVFALYVALALKRPFDRARFLARIGQGAAALAVFLIVAFAGGLLSTDSLSGVLWFFDAFAGGGRAAPIAESPALKRLVDAPLFHFAVYGGPALALAPLGWGLALRARPETARATAIAAAIFILVFNSWTIDVGSFFLPLLLGATLLAASAAERLGGDRSRAFRCAAILLFLLLAHHAAFLMPHLPFDARRYVSLAPSGWGPGAGFLAFVAATVIAGAVIDRSPGLLRSTASLDPRLFHAALAVATLNLALLGALPDALAARRPDDDRRLIDAFAAFAEPQARLITRIAPLRPQARLGPRVAFVYHELFFGPLGGPDGFDPVALWLAEIAADPDAPPLYLDGESYAVRDRVWSRLAMRAAPPLEAFAFTPILSGVHHFYRVEYRAR